MRSNKSVINIYKKQSVKSEVVTQLLYGDTFKKLKKTGSWIKIKNDMGNYKGYIKNEKFFPKLKNSHKVSSLYAKLYYKPNIKCKIKKKLSFGSKIKVVEKKENFCKFDNLWIKKSDLKDIKYKTKNTFKNIEKFINIKYKYAMGVNQFFDLI